MTDWEEMENRHTEEFHRLFATIDLTLCDTSDDVFNAIEWQVMDLQHKHHCERIKTRGATFGELGLKITKLIWEAQ